MLKTLKRIAGAALTGAVLAGSASAQGCGGTYEVSSGDTLSQIANRLYEDAGKWAAVYQANVSAIGKSPDMIRVGTKLSMPCIAGMPKGLEGAIEQASFVKASPLVVPLGNPSRKYRLNIVTGDDRLPWSDRDLPNGGMMTELVNAAMTAQDPEGGYGIHWVNDWSAHFEPLMSNGLLDAGFPWYRPDCANQPDTYRCVNLAFSDPVFEVLVLLWVNKDAPFALNSDDDVIGKTFCRPKGFATFFLDQHGRNWLKDGKIELKTPLLSDECFDMLAKGEVDAVIMNEFHGREAVAKLGLKESVTVAGGEPLAIQGLHVVVHKGHPQANEVLAEVNAGIAKIRDSGAHQKIVEAHLNRLWNAF